MKTFFFTSFLLVFSIICSAQSNHCIKNRYAQDTLFSLSQLDIRKDVKYGISNNWPGSGSMDLHMDIYMPDMSIDPILERPLAILVHGGAFLAGDKKDMEYYAKAYAQRGIVAVSIQYQLGWDCPSTDLLGICVQCGTKYANLNKAIYRAVQDTRGALKYLISNASTYKIDTSAIFLMGESAGSITALHASYWNQAEADSFCSTCPSVLGSLDTVNHQLSNQINIKGIIDNCGAITKPAAIDNNSIPVIGFHDELDCVVPYGNNRLLNCLGCTAFTYASGSNTIHNRLKSNGVHTQMNTKALSLGHCSYPKSAIVGKSICFIKSIFCKNTTTSSTNDIWNAPKCDSGYVVSTPNLVHEKLAVYPNPSQGNVTISLPSSISASYHVKVLNSKGQTILDQWINSSDAKLDLRNTAPGLKFLFIYNRQGELISQNRIVSYNF